MDDRWSIEQCFANGCAAPAPRFTGLPRYNFIGGHNAPENIPVEELAEAAKQALLRNGSLLALYNMAQGPQGFIGLREMVAKKLAEHRGIVCDAQDILATTGSTQGLKLVFELFLEAGDTIFVEELTYGSALSKLRALGVNIVGIAMDNHGMVVSDLARRFDEASAAGRQVKMVYTIPTIHNPTGSILPEERRQALVRLARDNRCIIFEDECYADLAWSQDVPRSIYAIAPDITVQIGSFSKTLAPALRVGYAVASWPVMSRLMAAKNDGGSGAVDQMVVAEYFSTKFGSHVAALTRTLAGRLKILTDAIDASFGTSAEYTVPSGGIFLWVRLPGEVDVRKLLLPAEKAGVAFNPGTDWAVEPETGKSMLRLCFALPSRQEIEEGIATLARICFEQTGIPAVAGNVMGRTA